jgi:hypothetical protein
MVPLYVNAAPANSIDRLCGENNVTEDSKEEAGPK